MKYIRLQANPKDVRVSIRRVESGWMVTVASRSPSPTVTVVRYEHADPKTAVDEALKRAEDLDIDGVDRGLEWTYDHPWKKD